MPSIQNEPHAELAEAAEKCPFYGNSYLYPTPDDNLRSIGVTHGLGDLWIVAWIKPNGSKKKISSPHLPARLDPDRLQDMLEAFAAKRKLQIAVVRPRRDRSSSAPSATSCRKESEHEHAESAELKPCPFCGETDRRMAYFVSVGSNVFYWYCERCGARGPRANCEKIAWTLWNRRAS